MIRFQNRDAFTNPFSVLITGDVCPRNSMSLPAAEIMQKVLPFVESADFRMTQFETVLTEQKHEPIQKCGPNLISDIPATLDLMKTLKIDLALLANNHTGDFGPDAAMETRSFLEKNGYGTVGMGYDPADAAKPYFMTLNGIRIAVLNFCENEFGTVSVRQAGTNPLDPLENIRAIRAAKKNADLVFVTVHGGHEYFPYPSPRMVKTYRAFADAGAALVFNCHTHCPLGMEWYNGIPIVYSPGNFYFPEAAGSGLPPCWFGGFLPKFFCDAKGVYAIEILPYTFSKSSVDPLDAAHESIFERDFQSLCTVIGQPEKLTHLFEVWSAHATKEIMDWCFSDQFSIPYPPAKPGADGFRSWLLPRNLFTCETHNDATRTYLRLVEEKRLDQVLPLFDTEIRPLQNPAWLGK